MKTRASARLGPLLIGFMWQHSEPFTEPTDLVIVDRSEFFEPPANQDKFYHLPTFPHLPYCNARQVR